MVYNVTVNFWGYKSCEVEADNPDEAREIAVQQTDFSNCDELNFESEVI